LRGVKNVDSRDDNKLSVAESVRTWCCSMYVVQVRAALPPNVG
jgi:hypothetical protein